MQWTNVFKAKSTTTFTMADEVAAKKSRVTKDVGELSPSSYLRGTTSLSMEIRCPFHR